MRTNLTIFHTVPIGISTFGVSIPHVIGLSRKEQMFRVYTSWVIATVANTSAMISTLFRYFTIVQLPTKPMRLSRLTSDSKSTVTKYVFTSSPNPTGPSFFYLRPKPKNIFSVHSILIPRGVSIEN